MGNYERISELLKNTKNWVLVREADGRNLVQDVEGSIITGMVTPSNAELIVRMRNQMGQILEELQQLRVQLAMMDRG